MKKISFEIMQEEINLQTITICKLINYCQWFYNMIKILFIIDIALLVTIISFILILMKGGF